VPRVRERAQRLFGHYRRCSVEQRSTHPLLVVASRVVNSVGTVGMLVDRSRPLLRNRVVTAKQTRISSQSNIYLGDPDMFERVTVATRIGRLKPRAWKRRSAGDGAQGPRMDDWACLPIERDLPVGGGFWLLARRNITEAEREISTQSLHRQRDGRNARRVRVGGLRVREGP
jgi:hypothetical protein